MPDSTKTKKRLSCFTIDGNEWVVRHLPFSELPPGKFGLAQVYRRRTAGGLLEKVSMRLGWRSFLKYGIVISPWPPELADDVYTVDGTAIVLSFRDPWVPFEKPVLPGGFDRESLWEATLDIASTGWQLRRIRFLDYESGEDRPFGVLANTLDQD